ncbi:tyrosine-type recombinase/integrase [Sphingomonas aurantiaca]|uniref:tyrosine-type recombinase/integrase n=1 Tax=Sphingomonas aurantiaca TaxID=185949 RepID=UPI002FE3CE3A
MALTVAEIRALQPRAAPYKVADENGLYLLITPSGTKLWKLKFRFRGAEKKLSFGQFPDISLKAARLKSEDARRQLANGIDPADAKRKAVVEAALSKANTFRLVADEYIGKMEREGKAPNTIVKSKWFRDLLDRDLGHRPVREITPHDLLSALKKIESRGHHESAQRARAFGGRVFRYAVVTLRADANPADVLRGALTSPTVKHHAAIIDPVALGGLMRAIGNYDGRPETRIALMLAARLFVRPGELRKGEWSELDLDEAVWRIPGDRMKMGQPHVVPLSTQSVALFRQLRAMGNPRNFMFPAYHTSLRPMSENTINSALRRLGYDTTEMTGHGFRSTASTLLNESGLWHPDAIERALAHKDVDRVRAAYHRGAHWAERVRMAQWWCDYLDQLRDGAEILRPAFRASTG